MNEKELVLSAIKARETAYAPYSEFYVGAALLCSDGTVFTGCNIENISYSATVCAERTAFFKAVSEGKREFSAIAIAGGKKGESIFAYPCGVCRQVMAEFCKRDFKVIVVKSAEKYEIYPLSELIPKSFDF